MTTLKSRARDSARRPAGEGRIAFDRFDLLDQFDQFLNDFERFFDHFEI